MTFTRRGVLGGGAVAGAVGLTPAAAQIGLPLPDVRKELWKSYHADTRVWGYCNRHSVRPGQTFDLRMSVGPARGDIKGQIEIFRVGNHPGDGRKFVARFENVDVPIGSLKITSAALGAGWPRALDSVDTTGWQSGYYTMDFVDAADGHRDLNIAYIIVLPPTDQVDILVIVSTNTFQAYNDWGGYSFYESVFAGDWGQLVSFDRPTPPDFFEYEFYLARWLEVLASARGWSVGYATNFDIHSEPNLSRACRLLISGSHNEYWSKEEFDHIYDRIFARGGNTVFFGANTAYWQVRYADLNQTPTGQNGGRHLVCYKSFDADPVAGGLPANEASLLKTGMFREQMRRPETMLMGVAYQSYFPAHSASRFPYRVLRVDLPFFADTGYQVGDLTPDVVGYEWDNRDPEGDGRRLWDAANSQIPMLEKERIKVVFEGSPVDLNGTAGKAEAIYFVSPAGAKVFSSGSIRWCWGLGKEGFQQKKFLRFNENLLDEFLKP